MEHRPPGPEEGAPIHDLTTNGVYPRDVYERPDWYSSGEENYWDAFAVVQRVHHRPNARLWVFRAAPCGTRTINPGDWVSTVKKYARQHGKHATDPAKDMCVFASRTEARCLHTDGNSLFEWGYNCPVPLRAQNVFRPRKKRAKRSVPSTESRWWRERHR
jgi:hypothetical protein